MIKMNPIITIKTKDGQLITGEQIQTNKKDWWLCNCGSMHKGFPYDCPMRVK